MKTVTRALKEGRCVVLEGDTEGWFITEEGSVVQWTEGRGSYLRVLTQGKVEEIEFDRPSADPDAEELRQFLQSGYPESKLIVTVDDDLAPKLRDLFK